MSFPKDIRLVLALLPAAALGAALFASPAQADPTESTIFDPTGTSLIGKPPAQRDAELAQIQDLGADTIRLVVNWRAFAPDAEAPGKPDFSAANPTDYPAHTFDALDGVVKAIGAHGMTVLMTPDGPAPDWASTGGTKGLNRPDAREFGRFVRALGERYSGKCSCGTGSTLPRVDFWSVWNEPNLFLFLHPQFSHGRSVSGQLYRGLFDAAQRALDASGHDQDPLLIGETAPTQGTVSTKPIAFLRDVLCLDASYHRVGHCRPLRASGWSQHPYNAGLAPWQLPANKAQISVGSLGRLTGALRKASLAGATTQRLPVYVTEFGEESLPEPITRYGETPQRQAEYVGISEYLLYHNPEVRSYAQYLLTDDPGRADSLSFQTGLRYADGEPKPALYAFPMTLVARRFGDYQAELWGHVRPASGFGYQRVDLSYRDSPSGEVRSAGSVLTDPDGYFSYTVPYADGRQWQATTRLADGRVLQGPYIRSYRFSSQTSARR